jgi:hypothetical protein
MPTNHKYVLFRVVAESDTGDAGPEPSSVSLNNAVFELPSVMPSIPNVLPLLLFPTTPE